MGPPSEPSFPHNVPLGGCHWLLRLVPAACPLFLCSFNAHAQLQCPGMGVEGSILACPIPLGLPRVLRPCRKRNSSGEGIYLKPLVRGRTQPCLLPHRAKAKIPEASRCYVSGKQRQSSVAGFLNLDLISIFVLLNIFLPPSLTSSLPPFPFLLPPLLSFSPSSPPPPPSLFLLLFFFPLRHGLIHHTVC